MPKHVHCELIKAWADGAKIQVLPFGETEWKDLDQPNWHTTGNYRIKPKAKVFKCRPYLYKNMDGVISLEVSKGILTVSEIESHRGFIKWLSDWLTYEVEDV